MHWSLLLNNFSDDWLNNRYRVFSVCLPTIILTVWSEYWRIFGGNRIGRRTNRRRKSKYYPRNFSIRYNFCAIWFRRTDDLTTLWYIDVYTVYTNRRITRHVYGTDSIKCLWLVAQIHYCIDTWTGTTVVLYSLLSLSQSSWQISCRAYDDTGQ